MNYYNIKCLVKHNIKIKTFLNRTHEITYCVYPSNSLSDFA